MHAAGTDVVPKLNGVRRCHSVRTDGRDRKKSLTDFREIVEFQRAAGRNFPL
jgi:hypothetical protein